MSTTTEIRKHLTLFEASHRNKSTDSWPIVGLSTAAGDVLIKVEDLDTAKIIENISAMSESDELVYWGIVYDLDEWEDENDGDGKIRATISRALAEKVLQRLIKANDKFAFDSEKFEDYFLTMWQDKLGLV